MEKKYINFIGFWSNFDKKNNIFYNILKERYDVQLSEKPDYVFVSPLCSPFEYLKYDCVRILYTGEPLSPDFNVFDYAIGFDYLSLLDKNGINRYYRYPLCLYNYDRLKKIQYGFSRDEALMILNRKKYFCNFIYGHRSAKGEREKLFEIISKYKRVESIGSFMNNMPNGEVIPFSEKKRDFLKQCKFTIACESVSHPGFVTEKLSDPIFSESVPIYFGNPLVAKEFNSDSFINCHLYNNFDEVLDYVSTVDSNDELYIKMLMTPKFVDEKYLDDLYSGLKEFLWYIFSEEGDDSYRRLKFYISKYHEDHLKKYMELNESKTYRLLNKINIL